MNLKNCVVVVAAAVLPFAAGCVVGAEPRPDESPEQSEPTESTEQATTIRTTVRNGCYIHVCRKDGSGQMHSVRAGNYVCDVYKNCYCANGGETAACDYGSTDCRQTCTKTTPTKVEWQPVQPGGTPYAAPPRRVPEASLTLRSLRDSEGIGSIWHDRSRARRLTHRS